MNVTGRTSPAAGDPIVIALLDALVDITKIDPSWMLPEHVLGKDLEMSEDAINQLAQRLATRFAPGGRFDCRYWADSSLRQVADFVRQVSSHGGWSSAA